MDSINQHKWSKKWLNRLFISVFSSVIVLAPIALIAYDVYGFYGALPIMMLFLIYSIPMNRFISKKNKEEVEKIRKKEGMSQPK